MLRPIAQKISIREINASKYVFEEGQGLNYLLTLQEEKIYRIHIMAIIVKKEIVGSMTNFILDDGTGIIAARIFEKANIVETVVLGDAVSLIGRVRMYNNEIYLSPDIFRKVDSRWVKVRLLELNVPSAETKEVNVEIIKPLAEPAMERTHSGEDIDGEITEEEITEEVIEEELLPTEKISKLIRDLDTGNGVLMEEIIEKSPLQDTEKLLEKMMERGDIFQNQPGKVKVL